MQHRRIGGLIQRAFIEGGLRLGVRKPARFALYRILGNDLPPRHSAGQTLTNVRFILDHEPAFKHVSKHWVLNRITDPAIEGALIALLTERGQDFLRIPFVLDDYARQGWDGGAIKDDDFLAALGEEGAASSGEAWRIEYRLRLAKNRYAMNNNGARNAAFEHGRQLADYVLPFDGNIFLTAESMAALAAAVRRDPSLRYLIVPMARIADQPERVLSEGVPLEAIEEPQIGFHRGALGRFDERLGYGLRPKVDLMTRLGVDHPAVMGPIDRWDLQSLPPPEDRGHHRIVGRVARLPSGLPGLEVGEAARVDRWLARNAGIIGKLDGLDRVAIEARLPAGAIFYDPAALAVAAAAPPGSPGAAIRASAVAAAEQAIRRGVMSVMMKTETAASGDRHDYLSRAPYFWPDPTSVNGLPSVYRDGQRVPEADLGRPEIAAFDRGRLHALIEGVVAAALAGRLAGERVYSDFAADCLRAWFLDPASAMNPNFAFAQVRPGHEGDRGHGSGLIELRKLPALLDAIRLVADCGALTPEERDGLRGWFAAFAAWMKTSQQGREARTTRNNIGSYYDLEMLSLSVFLEDADEIGRCLRRLAVRARLQFAETGNQAEEERRSMPQHYVLFNLMAWCQLAVIRRRLGLDAALIGGPPLATAIAHAGENMRQTSGQNATVTAMALAMTTLDRCGRGEDPPSPTAILAASDDTPPFWPLFDARLLAVTAPAPSPARRDAPGA